MKKNKHLNKIKRKKTTKCKSIMKNENKNRLRRGNKW